MVTYRSFVVAAGLGLAMGAGLAAAETSAARGEREAASGTVKLAEARRAADELRYDRAQELLGEALREGRSSPDTMVRIYELAASTAVVLGKDDLGELYYRRLLCIDPKADLEAGLAPKFKRPFAAARAYVSAHGALRSRARRVDGAVEIFVESDPLAMVASVAVTRGGQAASGVALDPSRRAKLPLPEGESRRLQLILVDEFGNQLQITEVPEETANAALLPPPPSETSAPAQRSLLRTWWVWTIPAAASLGVGIATGLQSQQASDDLDALLRGPNPHYDEAEDLRARSRSRATLANLSFGAAGVFAAVAVIMYATRPSDAPSAPVTVLAPVGPEGSVGVSLSGALPF